jgi:heptaprenyl diphosphate synthase
LTDERIHTIALFAAFCLFFSVVEVMIPKPVPFFRLGLANLPLLIAVTVLPAGEVLIIIALKILGQGIVSGTLLSYVVLFSAAGSLASGGVMIGLSRWHGRRITLVGIAVLGALASNTVQLIVSALLIFGESTRLIAPPFLLVGTVSGFLLGFIAERFYRNSHWLACFREGFPAGGAADRQDDQTAESSGEPAEEADGRQRRKTPAGILTKVPPYVRLAAGAAMIPPFLVLDSLLLKLLFIVLFVLVMRMAGKGFRLMPGLIVLTAVFVAHLLMPIGEVLLYVGDFPITAGAIREGLTRGLTLVGLVYLSRFAVSAELPIPGTAGRLLYHVFYYFEEITSFHRETTRRAGQEGSTLKGLLTVLRGLFQDIDRFLLEHHHGCTIVPEAEEGGSFFTRRALPVLPAVAAAWAILLLERSGMVPPLF